jgi:PPOX class probable F420-dependent enzyme
MRLSLTKGETQLSTGNQTVVPATHHDILAAPALAHVATIGPDGTPQSTPVWFDWDGEHLLLALAPDRQKMRNLSHDPRLAVSIVDPTNPIRYLEIRGRVTFQSDPDRSVLKRLVHKYTGSDDLSWVDGERTIVVVEPTRATYRK